MLGGASKAWACFARWAGLIGAGTFAISVSLGANSVLSAERIVGGAPDPAIEETIEALKRSLTGRFLIVRATEVYGGRNLRELIRWGDNSRTDAVLTRYLNPKTGEERRERRVMIYLKRGQSLDDRVLDLAHELVHATTRPPWDPYDPALTASGYIEAAIEGAGGEVDAVIAECQVGMELGLAQFPSATRCQGYFEKGDPSAKVLRERIVADFYRSGQWAQPLRAMLGERRLPQLSGESPALYSSTGKLPYPMALYNEFEALNEVACRNSIGRLQSSSAPVRSRASEFVLSRCQKR